MVFSKQSIYTGLILVIMCLTPVREKDRMLNSSGQTSVFAGKELHCTIDLGNEMYSSYGLDTGFNHELLKRFAEDNHCTVHAITAAEGSNPLDSLEYGKTDILITRKDSLESDGIVRLRDIDQDFIWAVRSSQSHQMNQLNRWISYMDSSDKLTNIRNRYTGTFNPHKRSELGLLTSTVSPYDEILRKYAVELGWDWRMVAAVVYQESKFSIGSISRRGAQGLMQVMPQTGLIYGVDNLLDPEQNILAGTGHLKRLEKIFSKCGLEHDELIKFTLAAYNAGEGRISDCRNLAAAKGLDNSKWENIVKVIPLMREDSILNEESVKLGKFQGHETIDYIDNVMSHYEAICRICPTSL